MRRHRKADELIQGVYTQLDPGAATGFRGCFYGCLTAEALAAECGVTVMQFVTTLEDDGNAVDWWHETERLRGIPVALNAVLDRLFEASSSNAVAGEFALSSLEAIPVGADLSLVTSRWLLDILADGDHGVIALTKDGTAQRTAVETVAALYRRRLDGDEPSISDWNEAADAAEAAGVADAAEAAWVADAAAGAAAEAAEVAEAAAWAAGAAGAASNAAGDARAAWCAWASDRLLTHLRDAPVPVGV